MKKILPLLFLLLIAMSTVAFAEQGVIAYYNDSSSKIIIQTKNGYTCGEVMSISVRTERGQAVVGELYSYASHDLYNLATDEKLRVWIDEYWLSYDDAIDWLAHQ